MNIEEIRDYCLSKEFVDEGFPFDNDTLVFKVMSKMFLLISLKESNHFNVKCDPERAVELREQFPEVVAGWHMNKKMWNTVYTDGSLNRKQIIEMIDHSYDEVVKGLPKKSQVLFKKP
jgi:predicted DNA-binding protein (MmcQ/YjbR family)